MYGVTSGGGANGTGAIVTLTKEAKAVTVASFPQSEANADEGPNSILGTRAIAMSPNIVAPGSGASGWGFVGVSGGGGRNWVGTVYSWQPGKQFRVLKSLEGTGPFSGEVESALLSTPNGVYGTIGRGERKDATLFRVDRTGVVERIGGPGLLPPETVLLGGAYGPDETLWMLCETMILGDSEVYGLKGSRASLRSRLAGTEHGGATAMVRTPAGTWLVAFRTGGAFDEGGIVDYAPRAYDGGWIPKAIGHLRGNASDDGLR